MNKSVIVLKIYLCTFGAIQQTKLISLRRNPINCDQNHLQLPIENNIKWKKINSQQKYIK